MKHIFGKASLAVALIGCCFYGGVLYGRDRAWHLGRQDAFALALNPSRCYDDTITEAVRDAKGKLTYNTDGKVIMRHWPVIEIYDAFGKDYIFETDFIKACESNPLHRVSVNTVKRCP